MNIAYRTPLTVPEYLAWAETQSQRVRAELIDGQISQMSPERIEHIELKLAIVLALSNAIQGAPIALQAITDGGTVAIDDTTAFQPDALVYAGARLPRGTLIIPEPVIVAEILSPTTAHLDRGVKLAGYFSLPSVQHYLIVDPDTMRLTHHHRAADGSIAAEVHAGGTLRLDPPGLSLDLITLFKT